MTKTLIVSLTETYVDALAPNAGAIKNGRDLVKKGSFPVLHATEDGSLLFGECKGSGASPYRCSVDFMKPEQPVFRCSCPSRQFPCKHNLGLLYAYLEAPDRFSTAPAPQDVADKREKAEQREERKKSAPEADAPVKRKINRSALTKKLQTQIEGLDLADKLLQIIVQNGLASVDETPL